MKVCAEPGCGELSDKTRCADHRREKRQARELIKGDRHAQGYGQAHRLERKRWARIVDAGEATCARCGERISPIDPRGWHLDHDDNDPSRTTYIGASHAICNATAPHRTSQPVHPQTRKPEPPAQPPSLDPGLILECAHRDNWSSCQVALACTDAEHHAAMRAQPWRCPSHALGDQS